MNDALTTSTPSRRSASWNAPGWGAAAEYLLDAWQRTILTWDVLRERGNQTLAHARSGKPPRWWPRCGAATPARR